MKNKTTTTVIVLAGMLLIGSLSACGDGESESAADTSTPEATEASTAETTETSSSEGSTVNSYPLVDTGQTSSYDADGNEIDDPATVGRTSTPSVSPSVTPLKTRTSSSGRNTTRSTRKRPFRTRLLVSTT